MAEFRDWFQESVGTTRYSIETNYRTNLKETLEAYAKIALGFVSAALKKYGFHIKHVYDQHPIRILVSGRNWDDGEWVVVVSWHPEHKCFVLTKGFYNKDRNTVSVQSSQKCSGDSASMLVNDIRNMMHHLQDQPDRHLLKLKKVPLKRGPK